MTEPSGWLIDKSAYARLSVTPDADEWALRISRGLVRIAASTLLEVGYSARSGPSWTLMMTTAPLTFMPLEPATPSIERRAIEVQGMLARRGQHRAPSIPDLLVAATAEGARLTVLHADKDFDLIAEITGQPLERLRLADG